MRQKITILVASLVLSLQVQAAISYDSGQINLNTTIPTTEITQSTFTFSGPTSLTIDPGSVRINLNISGGAVGDLFVQLIDPSGNHESILLNRVGLTVGQPAGYANAGFQGWLYDSALGGNIHGNGGSYVPGASQLTGALAPDGRSIASNSSGVAFDSNSPSRMLSVFDGINPNGTWTLKFFDDVSGGGGDSIINSWQLQLTAVPEPTNVALGVFGVVFAGVAVGRRLRVRARA